MSKAAAAICTVSTDCASSGCCAKWEKAATVATASTLLVCMPAGTAANAAVKVTCASVATATAAAYSAFNPLPTTGTSCSAFNGATLCAAAKAGASTLVASAAVVATAVYMM